MDKEQALTRAVEIQERFEVVERERKQVFKQASALGVSVRQLSESTRLTTGRVRGILNG
ncbi:hypothetical protein [Corynebacterium ulcerans]|uniref:hypothetical protein n=1 Tax=Corynebacterium ulcerans TaxID=65058 RepID=UPI0002141BCA|nr:hypothetical protein [Corynebacterium ulcerans]AEG84404.1 hypothetical protein CULC22_01694 [Corynebacterium ulcerans BR-AD22]